MSNYLEEQLREQVRLKILAFKEQKKQQQPGLSSIYDHINTQTQDSKKWMNKHLTPTKKGGGD